ncbi:CDP-alcohol phosphatidyltransferase family protein [Pseudomonas juntendi]|uniref:CDP-alcohol phosphatidyltransferase family protein n=1 Tax=Pseudomonas juntendi TaxID=2666183 RepID=UPI0032091B89
MPTLARVFPFVRLLDLANILTMFNISLAFGTVYFALQRRFVLAATVICLAAMLDFLDGHILAATSLLLDCAERRIQVLA